MASDNHNAPAHGRDAADVPGHHWAVLIITAVVQLMIVLDATIVNIALPAAQKALDINDANRQWILTAYTLAFGGLLLLGGRLADYLGRKRIFIIGMLGFAAASALGGIAGMLGTHGIGQQMLFAARGLQGAFAALLAPAGLALLTVTYTDEKERSKAFAVYGGIGAGGAAIGLVLGGVLTEYLNWRWCLLVNTPVAIITAFYAVRYITESRTERTGSYDIAGAILGTAGLVSLVYGFSKAGQDTVKHSQSAWGEGSVWAFILGGIALLVAFVLVEIRHRNPLLPMRIVQDRNRAGAYIAALVIGAGLFGSFLFLTYFFQLPLLLHYSPVKAGLASLPTSVGVFVAAAIASQMVLKLGPRVLMTAGGLIAAVAMVMFAQLEPTSTFLWPILPGELLLGLGLGFVFVPLQNVALLGITHDDAGVASAVLNATNQIGGSIGTALLNSVAITATAAYATKRNLDPHTLAIPVGTPHELAVKAMALVHGYQQGYWVAAGLLLFGALAVAVAITARGEDLKDVDAPVAS